MRKNLNGLKRKIINMELVKAWASVKNVSTHVLTYLNYKNLH